ncbi:MAG: hypothetical protein DMF78_22400 [Acidobacteria bacterium]|nr:MAG: hypothetical protein DMF78_22400 [Acidobacteriota bacterium]
MKNSVAAIAIPVLAAALVAPALEAAPLPGFVLTAQTPHFSFYSRGEKVEAQKVEQRVSELEKMFGQTIKHADYYRYATAQEVAAGTGQYAAGVTFAAAAEVHSTEAFHEHELVHLVAGQMGDPGAFFQEGLAVAIGNHGRWRGRSVDQVAKGVTASVDAMVAGFDRMDPEQGYAVAGSFVGYLVRTQGLEKVSTFFRACRPGTRVAAAFASTFNRTLDAAGASWRASL